VFDKSGDVNTTQLTWRTASYYCNFNNGSLGVYIAVVCVMWQDTCTDEKLVQNKNTYAFNQNNTARSVDGTHCWLLNENMDFCVGFNKYVLLCVLIWEY
jgi:hypothetical protein